MSLFKRRLNKPFVPDWRKGRPQGTSQQQNMPEFAFSDGSTAKDYPELAPPQNATRIRKPAPSLDRMPDSQLSKSELEHKKGPVKKRIKRWVFGILIFVFAVSAYHLACPEIDVKMFDAQTNVDSGELVLTSFKLSNEAFLEIKDPVIACDMNGPSGTTIKTVTKTVYEILPSGNTREFPFLQMGETVDQAVQFKCYVKSAKIAWSALQ
jgi:hypothetical protein